MKFEMGGAIFYCTGVILALLLELTASKYAHNECKSAELESCYCGETIRWGNAYFLVNCTATGFTDASMLRTIPPETEALIFSGNHVESLPENIFGDNKTFTKLKIIDMSNNGIRMILGKTFHHVPNVETLFLNHNDLKISREEDKNFHHPRVFSNFLNLRELHLTNAFADNTDYQLAEDLHDIFDKSNLTKLMKLHLEQNEIKYFRDPKVFCNLPSLTQLYLGNNFISHVDFASLECLKLQFLDLRNNTITELSDDDLRALDVLEDITLQTRNMSVDIRGNPLKCSSAVNLHDWLSKTNVDVHKQTELQCYMSSGTKRYPVNLNTVFEAKHAKLSKAVTVLLVMLGLVLTSLLAAYAYIHRSNLRNRMAPIFDVVSRKVEYTTIESQIV